ncbi:hypothetical protein FOQG_18352 [Fusarium oxysporum f. sp. raphani 54005]|uniref:Uncharacterized protein n=1 Tax=Fusarium oxysporum f. sp. raphani 54005 TaxID=1089458 RepID=X0B457_FUSOX|nr:hypothetical protein FOQG_18352 [Fusarium oxysporum f. sp. raphani 54005]
MSSNPSRAAPNTDAGISIQSASGMVLPIRDVNDADPGKPIALEMSLFAEKATEIAKNVLGRFKTRLSHNYYMPMIGLDG